MLLYKEMFVAVPKAWSVKGMKALPGASNFLETATLPCFGMCLFHFWLGVSPDTSGLTILSPCVIPSSSGLEDPALLAIGGIQHKNAGCTSGFLWLKKKIDLTYELFIDKKRKITESAAPPNLLNVVGETMESSA